MPVSHSGGATSTGYTTKQGNGLGSRVNAIMAVTTSQGVVCAGSIETVQSFANVNIGAGGVNAFGAAPIAPSWLDHLVVGADAATAAALQINGSLLILDEFLLAANVSLVINFGFPGRYLGDTGLILQILNRGAAAHNFWASISLRS